MNDLEHHKRRLRIALAITELEVGGAERCLVELACRLDPEQFDVQVYALAQRPENDSLVVKLEEAAIPVDFIGARRSRQVFRATARLSKLLRKQSPDLLQTFLFHANITGMLAARLAGVPKIVTGVRVADRSSWRHRAERWFTRRADRIVCVSRSVANFCEETVGLPKDSLISIPNGVDTTLFSRQKSADLSEFSIDDGEFVVVTVGRLERQKGIDWLLNATAQLFRPESSFRLLVVGDGPDRTMLENQAKSLGIQSKVHFAGWRPDVPDILAACDMFVLPSRWEGMPNVLLEAMASRLPAVATSVEGVNEILGPLADQQTVQFGDSSRLVRQIRAIANKKDLADSLALNNFERVNAEFSLEYMVQSYSQLYRSMIPSHSAGQNC